MVLILAKLCVTSLPLIKTPFLAPLPIPATLDTGTPITRAPGHPRTKIVIASSTFLVINPTTKPKTKTAGVYHCENLSMNLSATDLLSWASSTNSMILPKLVSSPTLSARICIVPFSKIVPANTSEPTSLETGMDSPVMLASLIEPSPEMTVPSTPTLAPVLSKRMSPSSTKSMSISSNSPSSFSTSALSGASSVSSLMADLVLFKVNFSK